MSERDGLAFELFVGDNGNQPRESSIQDWIWFTVARKAQGQVEHYKAMAEHALAVGYRKPRTVVTEAEVQALPLGSVVLDADGDTYRSSITSGQTAWWQAGPQGVFRTVALPAKVLHEGGAS